MNISTKYSTMSHTLIHVSFLFNTRIVNMLTYSLLVLLVIYAQTIPSHLYSIIFFIMTNCHLLLLNSVSKCVCVLIIKNWEWQLSFFVILFSQNSRHLITSRFPEENFSNYYYLLIVHGWYLKYYLLLLTPGFHLQCYFT